MNRRQTSGGQALILVTLGLLAMCGMMGLAVDMGWSFFVHKQAQTAADAAALGAVEEAFVKISGGGTAISEFTCAAGVAISVTCTAQESCSKVVGSGTNLENGCQYALRNGFNWPPAARQDVTIESNDATTFPATAPGVRNLVYWATVRTVQTVPQLFSAMITRTEGTVSAVSTAALAASIGPGQFYGMNREGDGTNVDPATGTGGQNYGVDYLGAPGKGSQTACGNGKANLCAPAGIILSSNCAAKTAGVCDNGIAGDGVGMGSTLTIMGNGKGGGGSVTGTWSDMNGNSLTPCPSATCIYTTSPQTFADPTAPNPQPPLVSELKPNAQGQYPAIGSCGYPGGLIPAGVTLGPYQYYSYHTVAGVKVPDGAPITLQGTVTFSNGASGCPDPNKTGNIVYTQGADQSASQFPTYVFYGGMAAGSSTVTMDPGQYVMAGTNTTVKLNGNTYAPVFSEFGATISANAAALATGAMWIFTDANYPGLANQLTNVPGNTSAIQNLNQGTLVFKDGSIDQNGLIGSANQGSHLPPGLDAYSGIAWWQDRRNSDVGYEEAPGAPGCPDCTVGNKSADNGSVLYCATGGDCQIPNTAKLAAMMQANHVTSTSPGLVMDPGKANIALNGVFYQPRGAWLDFIAGNAGFTCSIAQGGGPNQQCPLQVVTGALLLDHGTVSLNLAGPTNPIIQYRPVLIH